MQFVWPSRTLREIICARKRLQPPLQVVDDISAALKPIDDFSNVQAVGFAHELLPVVMDSASSQFGERFVQVDNRCGGFFWRVAAKSSGSSRKAAP